MYQAFETHYVNALFCLFFFFKKITDHFQFLFYRDARLTLLHTAHWSVLEKSEAVKDLALDDLKLFSTRLKASFNLECLVQGNYSNEQALEVALCFKKNLQSNGRLSDGTLSPIRICQVPLGNKCCRLASFHPTDSNSVVVNYYQVGPTNMRQTAIMEIIVVCHRIMPFCITAIFCIYVYLFVE